MHANQYVYMYINVHRRYKLCWDKLVTTLHEVIAKHHQILSTSKRDMIE